MPTIKERLIERAGELFMRLGIRSVTMDEIASCMGMSKKTLYQHFVNKDDLIQQTVMAKVQEDLGLFQEITGEAENAIEEMLKVAQHIIQTLRKISPVVIYDLQKYHQESWQQMEAYQQVHIYSHIQKNIKRGQAEGLYRQNIEADIVSKLYVSTTMHIVFNELFPAKEYAKHQIAEEFIKYHLYGLVSSKGKTLIETYYNNES